MDSCKELVKALDLLKVMTKPEVEGCVCILETRTIWHLIYSCRFLDVVVRTSEPYVCYVC